MATVTTTRAATTFALELTEAEALYVHDALRLVTPTYKQFANSDCDDHDPVHTVLAEALRAAGLPTHEANAALY